MCACTLLSAYFILPIIAWSTVYYWVEYFLMCAWVFFKYNADNMVNTISTDQNSNKNNYVIKFVFKKYTFIVSASKLIWNVKESDLRICSVKIFEIILCYLIFFPPLSRVSKPKILTFWGFLNMLKKINWIIHQKYLSVIFGTKIRT